MLKYYIFILILLGLFVSSFFFYYNFKTVSFVEGLSEKLLNLTNQELNGSIPNNIVLCISEDSYLVFSDNNGNLVFDEMIDKSFYSGSTEDFDLDINCYDFSCKYNKNLETEIFVKKYIPVDFNFFSPKQIMYKILFDSVNCFIDFEKY